jgi:hypothetical protein
LPGTAGSNRCAFSPVSSGTSDRGTAASLSPSCRKYSGKDAEALVHCRPNEHEPGAPRSVVVTLASKPVIAVLRWSKRSGCAEQDGRWTPAAVNAPVIGAPPSIQDFIGVKTASAEYIATSCMRTVRLAGSFGNCSLGMRE